MGYSDREASRAASSPGHPKECTMTHAWHDVHIGPEAPREFLAVMENPESNKVKCELDRVQDFLGPEEAQKAVAHSASLCRKLFTGLDHRDPRRQ